MAAHGGGEPLTLARFLFCVAALAGLVAADGEAQSPGSAHRIYAVTFRGMTDVERGFQDYFASRRIPVQITFRDMNNGIGRMPSPSGEFR